MPPQCFHAAHPLPPRYHVQAVSRLDGMDTKTSLATMGWPFGQNWKLRVTPLAYLHHDASAPNSLPASFFDTSRPANVTPAAMSLATHGFSQLSLDPAKLQLIAMTPAVMSNTLKCLDAMRVGARGGFSDISEILSQVGVDPNSVRCLFAAVLQSWIAGNMMNDCRSDFPPAARLKPATSESFEELIGRCMQKASPYLFEEPLLPPPTTIIIPPVAEPTLLPPATGAVGSLPAISSLPFTNPVLLSLFNESLQDGCSAQHLDGSTFITLVSTTVSRISLFSEIGQWATTILKSLQMFNFKSQNSAFHTNCIDTQQVKSRVDVLILDAERRNDTLNPLQLIDCLGDIKSLKQPMKDLHDRLDKEQATQKSYRKFAKMAKRGSSHFDDDLDEDASEAVDNRVRNGVSKMLKQQQATLLAAIKASGVTKSPKKDKDGKGKDGKGKGKPLGTGFNLLKEIITTKFPTATDDQARAAARSIANNKCCLCGGAAEAIPPKKSKSCVAKCKNTTLYATFTRAANALTSV